MNFVIYGVTCITMTDTTDLHDSSSNQDPSNVFQKKKFQVN